jgi:hypothetical protein
MKSIAASGDWNDEFKGKFAELVKTFKSTQTY